MKLPLAFKVLCLLLLFPNSFTQALAGEDFSRFLRENKIRVKVVKGLPALIPSETHEKYWALDSNNALYQLRLSPASDSYRAVAASALAEYLGLPQVSTFPTLLKRGQKNIPSTDEVTQWYPEFRPSSPLASDEHELTATLTPAYSPTKIVWNNLNTHQSVSLAKALIFMSIAGAPIPKFADGKGQGLEFALDPSTKESNFLFTNKTDFFQYGAEPRSLNDYFEAVPWDQFPQDVMQDPRFLSSVNEFLDRLTSLNKNHVKKILEGYTRTLDPRDSEALFLQLESSVNSRRLELARWALSHHLNTNLTSTRALPMEPILNLPELKATEIIDPQVEPTEALWNLFFEASNEKRSSQMAKWKSNLKISVDDILKKAFKQFTYYFVSSDREWKNSIRSNAEQFALNSERENFLLALSTNDTEAKTIARIAEKVGVKTHDFKLANRGWRIYQDHVAALIQEAKAKKLKKIVFIEPQFDSSAESLLRFSGLEIVIIDHHDSNGVNRTHSLSSLEQFADMIGYKLSGYEKQTGVIDRSGDHGLQKMGITRQVFEDKSEGFNKVKEILTNAKVAHFKTAEGKEEQVLVVTEDLGNLGGLSRALNEIHPGRITNVLSIGVSVRFVGKTEISQWLLRQLKGRTPNGDFYSGGGDLQGTLSGAFESFQKRIPISRKKI